MKKCIVILTVLVIIFSAFTSILGVLSLNKMDTEFFTTIRGEQVEIVTSGIYKYNVKTLVVGGIPFDIIRLISLPVLIIALILFIMNSFKSTLFLIGMISNLLYQYILWSFNWAYNSLYLVFVVTFSLCIIIIILIFIRMNVDDYKKLINDRFPVKSISIFTICAGIMILLKCIGEIAPTISSGSLPFGMAGYNTLIDQGLDIGIIFPFAVISGVLLYRKNIYGYILSIVNLVIFFNLGLSVIAGAVLTGVITGKPAFIGISVFSVFLIVDLYLLIAALYNMKSKR